MIKIELLPDEVLREKAKNSEIMDFDLFWTLGFSTLQFRGKMSKPFRSPSPSR
jgi:hypothetical protein